MVQTATRNGSAVQLAQPTAEERRRIAMLEVMGTREALSALEHIAAMLPEQEAAVASVKLAVQLAREALEIREAELAYEAAGKGKNDQERKALAESAKGGDDEYKARREKVREQEERLADCERAAGANRRLERYWHAFLALRTAQVNYLARGD